MDIEESQVRIYNETKSLLWQRKDVDPQVLLVAVSDRGNQALVTPNRDVPPFVIDRIAAVPNDKVEPSNWTPTKIYTAFSETMSEQYAFFEERSFDWNQRLSSIRPKVNDKLDDSQSFELISQSLEGIDDAHVQLGATINGEPRRANLGMPGTMKQGIELFKKQTEYKEFADFLASRTQALEASIAETILGGNAKQACEQLTWGKTNNNVGYLYISGMSDFSEKDSLEEQLAELHSAMETILAELRDTRALIVDVSTNGGGSDVFSRAIASHFADKRRLAFSKEPRNAPDIRHSIFVEPYNKSGKPLTYSQPVYLVTSDITVSAAEIFVLCMKDIPHVTVVGQPTRGALSDVLSKTLPNGWAFGLSNEVYRDSRGICFEAKGIPPKINMTIIDPAKPDLGHAAAIASIAEMTDR